LGRAAVSTWAADNGLKAAGHDPSLPMSFSSWFRRLRQRAPDRVTFTADAVTRTRPDGVQETIRWDDLDEVTILTTDEGPWREDVFFLLSASGGESGCAVPQSADGTRELLERLQQLPGFDNGAVIKAMGSTSVARFVCWKRPGASP
jgi:hypothetical protein